MPGGLIARLRGGSGARREGGPAAGPLDALWEEIDLLERVHPPLSTAVRLRRPGDVARARAELAPLERWPQIPEGKFSEYVADTHHVRLHRVLRFVRDGDRVLDVGIGYGYVTALLRRERRLAAYWGIDVEERFAAAALAGLQANGVDPSGVELPTLDLFDIDAAWLATRQPDVVLVLELLEHLPDPAAALRALAAGLRDDALVLFTVPIFGRLDDMWAHVSLFDRRRIELICAEAGLTIHYVEPVIATWALVAASRGTGAPARLAPLAAEAPRPARHLRRAAGQLPHPRPRRYRVHPVHIGGSRDYRRPQHDAEHVDVRADPTGVFCAVRADAAAPETGGVRLEIAEPELIRLELSCEGAEDVEEIAVTGLDAQERVRIGWVRKPNAARPFAGVKRTSVLRPGRPAGNFSPLPGEQTPDGVVAVDVLVRVRAGGSATLRLHRAMYAGPEPPVSDDRSA